jgi:1-acyl-sn-glycerol-3-phosphate acyltransferase
MTHSTTVESPPPVFRLKRKLLFASFARRLAQVALTANRLVLEDGDRIPASGPALILPKHCSYRDILVEGVLLHRAARRYANYVMKTGLSAFLELPGGVRIVRPKDIRRAKDRDERRRLLEEARRRNSDTIEYLAWLYRSGECVISHPEGTRHADSMGVLQKEIVEHLKAVEQQSGIRVPMIPVGIEYVPTKPRSTIHFRVGEPIYSDQFENTARVMSALVESLESLSFQETEVRPREG